MQLKAVDCISLFCIYPTYTSSEEIILPYTSLCVVYVMYVSSLVHIHIVLDDCTTQSSLSCFVTTTAE